MDPMVILYQSPIVYSTHSILSRHLAAMPCDFFLGAKVQRKPGGGGGGLAKVPLVEARGDELFEEPRRTSLTSRASLGLGEGLGKGF